MPWVLILAVVVAVVALGAWMLSRRRDDQAPALAPGKPAGGLPSARGTTGAGGAPASAEASRATGPRTGHLQPAEKADATKAGRTGSGEPSQESPQPQRKIELPLPAASVPRMVADESHDDDDQDITLVGVMPDEIRALQKGYRDIRPEEALSGRSLPDDGEIEIGPEEAIDQVLIDELLADEPTGPQLYFAVDAVARTDVGLRRKGNEDSYVEMPEIPLFVVADGMGGHAAGDVASGLTVDVIRDAFLNSSYGGPANILWPRRADELARSIESANKAVFTMASGEDRLHGMGTTVTAIRFAPQKRRAYVAHVGDSRCYRIRRGHILRLTNDHTLGNLMGAKGKLANQLSQAIGVRDDVKVDLTIDRPENGDLYLLCSDGLTKMVPDDVIKEIILETPDLEECAKKLVDEANSLGGYDNITLVLMKITSNPPA